MPTFFRRRSAWPRRVTASILVFVAMVLQVAAVLAVLAGHRTLAVVCLVAAGCHFASPAFWAGQAVAARRHQQRLVHAVGEARKDPLTGLPNRALADDMIAAATTARSPMTVALIDVTGLHTVNGNFGHAAGDQYLTTIARRLTSAVPSDGALVRQGGDEFTLLAPNTGPQDLADRIGAALSGRAVIAGYRMQPRAAVGIAATDDRGTVDARHARARADMAMFTAKRDGGNQIRIFDPSRDPEPSPDGTRPLLRRRDLDPAQEPAPPWPAAPGDELIPLLLSPDDIHAITHALASAAGAARTSDPGSGLSPARYAGLLRRLQPIVESVHALNDATGTPD